MRRMHLLNALTMAALLASPATAQVHPDAQRLLDRWLAAQQRYLQLPALSVAVHQGSAAEALMWSRGYGFVDAASKVPARGDTLFGICSVSKVFTATAVMQQVERGLYRLDDDVAKLLPDAGLPAASAEHGAVTVRSLLTHASGLAREAAFPYWEPPTFPFPSREQLRSQPAEALHAPREHLHYSNHGIALLGELVAQHGGRPFGEWVQSQLLEPLGLKDTRPSLPAALHGTRLAQGWSAPNREGQRQQVAPYDAKALAPSAGFSSSPEDLVRFAQWQLKLLAGQAVPGVLNAASLRELHRVQFQDPADKRLRGLAWRLVDEDGERVVMHDGLCPGQVSLLAMVPARTLALAIAVSGHHSAWIDDYLGRPARQLLLAGAKLPAAAPALHEFAGRYDESPWTSETWLVPWGAQLLMLSLPSNDPMGDATRFAPAGRDAFRVQRADGSLGEWLRFERDAQGRVVRAAMSHQGMPRVEGL